MPNAAANVALVEKMWECFRTGDTATLRTLFTPEVVYRMPGHHPIAGTKRGIEELFAFFSELTKTHIQVDLLKIGALADNQVVEMHHGQGGVKGAVLDVVNCNIYTIHDGKIARVDCYNGDQHAIDNFFNVIYAVKPIPDRLAN
ncbi:MAG TPA: nuclear transport factor 2 family protein [Gemmataceae bacterium]|nr:nuclear transport factor 2 family protein [Gemmataceae bacterium]